MRVLCWILRLFRRPGAPTGGRASSGADRAFAGELRAMKRAAAAPDPVGAELLAALKGSALKEVAAYDRLADEVGAVCDSALAELDALTTVIYAALKKVDQRALKQLRPDARGRAWLAAGLPCDTGELDLGALDELLAASA